MTYMPPLPEAGGSDYDALTQWLQTQTLSFQKIITGSLQVGQILSSSNYVAGSAGWMIDGDGNAEFNDILVRGDIESGNWDGTSPANLATVDTGATTGYYLDASVGSAQFEGDVFVGGDIYLDGSLYLESSGAVTSPNWGAAQGASAELPAMRLTYTFVGVRSGVNITNDPEGVFLGAGVDYDGDSGGTPANMYSYTGIAFGHTGADSPFPPDREFFSLGSDTPTDPLQADNWTASPAAIFYSERQDRLYISSPGTTIENKVTFEDDIRLFDGSASSPGLQFDGDVDTGIYRVGTDILGFATAGVARMTIEANGEARFTDGSASSPGISFISDPNTGLYRVSADTIGISLAGALVSTLSAGQFLFPAGTATTSPGISFQGDSNTGFYRYAADRIGVTTGGVYQAAFIDGGAESSFYIDRRITDVGNHETLRVNADSTAGLAAVGYYSSWAGGKKNIIPLLDSPRFPGLDIIDRISGVDFKRKSTKQREWGFVLDDFKELDDNLRYMTTKGDEWGYSPDEMAFIAVLWESNRDLRKRVAALEQELKSHPV